MGYRLRFPLCYNRPRADRCRRAFLRLQWSGALAISFSARVVVPPHVLLQQVGEESVLLNLEKESYFGLDPVGTRMWQALTKAATVEDAYQELLAGYEVVPDRLRQDLAGLIEKLVENGLLETSSSCAPPRRASEGAGE